MKNKRGQITLFIILGIVIVGSIVSVFIFKDKLFSSEIPSNMQPIYSTFLSCLEEDTLTGISVLESQGGYIDLPEFKPGSQYMSFGSQLNFLGNPIPYWYYVSGNNLPKEQIPSKREMENKLGDYLEKEIRDCVFEKYYLQGFEINQGEPEVSVEINNKNVVIDLDMPFNINFGEDSSIVKSHSIEVKSKLGSLYNSARIIYDKEMKDLFLENYAVDILRLYAPVDGVEMTCSPLVWSAEEVFDELQEAIEVNTQSLKIKGGDYSLSNKENKYFIIDVEIDADVRFLNSKNWANSFEVAPSEDSVLISKPVGNQPGLGILGFCYVPYHFVYNLGYPVLVQISLGNEIFQFPLAVVIQGNKPRKSLSVEGVSEESPKLCENKNTLIDVNIYDSKLNFVEADISYECFSEICNIGETINGNLRNYFPQCVNGYIVVKADGFKETKYLYSVIKSGNVDIILDKLYELEINLKLSGINYYKDALISFISDDFSKTIVYPQQKSIKLSEGQYEIQVQIYKNSSLKIEETVKEQCMEIPQSGLGGIFGLTEEKCFDIEIPAQIISNALAGGGKENYYVLESELSKSNIIEINALSLPTPKSLEQLQDNYLLFESKNLDVRFK
jgi:hypothetical protein